MKYGGVFESIAKSILSHREDKQTMTTGCIKVLDNKIRPVIKQAKKDISIEDEQIEFHPEDARPYITIRSDDIGSHEIRFTCLGNTVIIQTRIGNEAPTSDTVLVKDVKEDLIVHKVVNFFCMAYSIEAPKPIVYMA